MKKHHESWPLAGIRFCLAKTHFLPTESVASGGKERLWRVGLQWSSLPFVCSSP
jgi:hypothetical protein